MSATPARSSRALTPCRSYARGPSFFPESEFRDAGANTLDQNLAAAGQPLVLRATTPLGMAEAIEVASGEDGRLVICGARIGPMVVDASDQAAPRP